MDVSGLSARTAAAARLPTYYTSDRCIVVAKSYQIKSADSTVLVLVLVFDRPNTPTASAYLFSGQFEFEQLATGAIDLQNLPAFLDAACGVRTHTHMHMHIHRISRRSCSAVLLYAVDTTRPTKQKQRQ